MEYKKAKIKKVNLLVFFMYNLQLEDAISEIKKKGAKSVLVQLPEGLKPKALEISDRIERETGVKCFIWLGSCFGACDIPKVNFDLVIQWGHTEMI